MDIKRGTRFNPRTRHWDGYAYVRAWNVYVCVRTVCCLPRLDHFVACLFHLLLLHYRHHRHYHHHRHHYYHPHHLTGFFLSPRWFFSYPLAPIYFPSFLLFSSSRLLSFASTTGLSLIIQYKTQDRRRTSARARVFTYPQVSLAYIESHNSVPQ